MYLTNHNWDKYPTGWNELFVYISDFVSSKSRCSSLWWDDRRSFPFCLQCDGSLWGSGKFSCKLNQGTTAGLARLHLLQYMVSNKHYLLPLIGQVEMFIRHSANHTGPSEGRQILLPKTCHNVGLWIVIVLNTCLFLD